jgi:hypothetical protein
VAALSPRQRELRRLRARCDPSRRAVRGRARGREAHLQGARRRPAVRHRQAVSGRHVGQAHQPHELRQRAAASARPRSEGCWRDPDLHDPGERQALPGDPRRRRPGQRRAPAPRRSRR